ncbi:MAG: NUDIX domain-containing protein [Acidimicrobiales bacterium]|nr:NUDIX domain-containing protein [Acidimicrobiales bacterium]
MSSGPIAPQDVPVRDAATVMLVRDSLSGNGIEVFMLRRNLKSDFVGGAFVFPGGAVDDADRNADLDAVCHGRSDADASRRLGLERGGLAFWVAAIRECFEEAGVLLAYDSSGELVRFDDPEVDARFRLHRKAIDDGQRRLVEICAVEGLQLAVDAMYYFSHWITPEGAPRRYDTRFFVARAPEAQEPLHDDREVIANLWIAPAEALERHEAGDFDLIFPTMRSLVTLSRFDCCDELIEAAAATDEVPAILPRIVEDEGGGYRIVLPGDPTYDDVVPAALPEGTPMNRLGIIADPASREV